MKRTERNTLLHLLRNPFGWSTEVVREARLKAADELERLWRLEANAVELAKEFVALTSNQQNAADAQSASVNSESVKNEAQYRHGRAADFGRWHYNLELYR